jgi:hypothetical protein
MRFEMYVRNGELGEIFEDLFGLLYKYLVFVQCAQTHVVLPKERMLKPLLRVERKDWWKKKRTSTDPHPVMLTPLVRSSRAIPQLIATKPGDWRDSMRYTTRRIISWVSAAGVALGSNFSSVVL